MAEIFDDDTDAVFFVDAGNAFNSINRSVIIQNIKIICYPMFAENCYCHEIRLFVIGGVELKSTEGITQEDPIAMAFYGLSHLPLMSSMTDHVSQVKQVTYADNLTGAGKIRFLKVWWSWPEKLYLPKSIKILANS